MLDVKDLTSGYGELTVIKNTTFSVENEIFAVLGANGSGKTTLLKTLARILPVQSGKIKWQGTDITGLPAFSVPELGVSYVPQEHSVFPDLTVAENLSIGGLVGRRPKEERLEEIYDLFPRLAERKEQAAGSLSGGEGQMLAVGRALMQDPKILLLDEPSAGLSPLFVDILFEKITEIRKDKEVTIVLAEQNAVKTLEIADRVMVLSLGEIHLLRETEDMTMKDIMEAYHI